MREDLRDSFSLPSIVLVAVESANFGPDLEEIREKVGGTCTRAKPLSPPITTPITTEKFVGQS